MNSIFDLTLPSFGSRLYVVDIFKDLVTVSRELMDNTTPANTVIEALYYKYSLLCHIFYCKY
jgi:hypothetical protein